MKAIILYQENQVSLLTRYLAAQNSSLEEESVRIFALRADVEKALDKTGIKYISAKHLRSVETIDRLALAETITQQVIDDPRLSFWEYDHIALGKVHRISMQDYLAHLLYWIDIIVHFERQYEPTAVLLWRSDQVPVAGGLYAKKFANVVTTAVELVCKKKGVSLTVFPNTDRKKVWVKKYLFSLEKSLFSLLLLLVNTLVSLTQKKTERRYLVSDIWRNVKPYAGALSNAELILFDRLEFFRIDWRNIFRYRIRFLNAGSFHRLKDIQFARAHRKKMSEYWNEVNKESELFTEVGVQGISLQSILLGLLQEAIVTRASHDVRLIRSVTTMLQTLRPNAVLVRASASRQPHFPLLCLVAQRMNIPSVEPQHGLFYLGPCSVPKYSASEYLATYGPLPSAELESAGYIGKTVEIGSPRFDVYQHISSHRTDATDEKRQPVKVLFVLPDDTTGAWFDTYDINDLLENVALLAAGNSNVHITVKARPIAPMANFGFQLATEKSLSIDNVSVARDEPLDTLFAETDVVVSVFSTILVEAMAAGLPVIYWAQPGFHASIVETHMEGCLSDGTILAADSYKTLAEQLENMRSLTEYNFLRNKISTFTNQNFVFGQGSGKRFAKFVTSVNKR